MDLHQLEQFLELAKYQHVSMTAAFLNISQPALSKSIANLEKELGVKLFDRVGHSIVLNSYGEQFARYAEQSLNLLKDGIAVTQSNHYETSGKISVRIYTYASLLHPCIQEYSSLNPHISFQLIATNSMQSGISEKELWDFILCSPSRSMITSEQFWIPHELFREKQFLAVSPLFREFPEDKTTISLTEMKDAPFVIRAQNDLFFQDPTYQTCYYAGFIPYIYCRSDDFLTRLKIIRSGMAVGFMDESNLKDAKLFDPSLRFFELTQQLPLRPITLMRKKKAMMSDAALDFWDFVLDYYHAGNDVEE